MTFAELAYKVFSDEKGEVSLSKVLGSILILMGAVASLFPSYQSAANSLLLMGSGALGWGNVRKDGTSPASSASPAPSISPAPPTSPAPPAPSASKVEETKPPSA